jgi:hypothetical protein
MLVQMKDASNAQSVLNSHNQNKSLEQTEYERRYFSEERSLVCISVTVLRAIM